MSKPETNEQEPVKVADGATPTVTGPKISDIAKVLKVMIDAEETEVAIIQAMYPDSAVVKAAVAALPTLQPILQELDLILGQISAAS